MPENQAVSQLVAAFDWQCTGGVFLYFFTPLVRSSSSRHAALPALTAKALGPYLLYQLFAVAFG
jgi:hypothetical protein